MDFEQAQVWLRTGFTNGTGAGGSGPAVQVAEEPVLKAYNALIKSSLLPAVLATLYFTPTPTFTISPYQSLPLLSDLHRKVETLATTRQQIQEIQNLCGGKNKAGRV